ncbi:MAG: hypothetical protein IKS22_09785 [Bacteroidales bacterium]|nr:hypothetical protein [Bacteroidales bacterium]
MNKINCSLPDGRIPRGDLPRMHEEHFFKKATSAPSNDSVLLSAEFPFPMGIISSSADSLSERINCISIHDSNQNFTLNAFTKSHSGLYIDYFNGVSAKVKETISARHLPIF